VVNPAVNTGRYDVDRLLVGGGGMSFRQQVSGSVTGLRVVNNSWFYLPLDEMDCSVIDPWEAQLVDIDASNRVTNVVAPLPCG
jgi:hypothetical protein